MKKLIRPLSILTAILLSLSVELLPANPNFEKANRILYALIAIVLSIWLENYINKQKFFNEIKIFIKRLKEMRGKKAIDPDGIQEIMKMITEELAIVLEQSDNLQKQVDTNAYDMAGTYPCGICGKDHQTDYRAKCNNCKIGSELWKEVH